MKDELLLYQYIFECVEVTLTQIIIIIMAELPTSAILVTCSGDFYDGIKFFKDRVTLPHN